MKGSICMGSISAAGTVQFSPLLKGLILVQHTHARDRTCVGQIASDCVKRQQLVCESMDTASEAG